MIVALFSATCSSSNDEENYGKQEIPSLLGKRLTKINLGTVTKEYTYDNQGRIIKIQDKSMVLGEIYDANYRTYTYDNNTIIETIYEYNFSYQVTYTLEKGRIIELYNRDSNRTYNYDYKDGFLIEEYSPNRQIHYNWNDGNLMSVTYENENTKETYEYTNYTCPQGFFPFGHYVSLCRIWGMSGFLGKSMKNLPSKYTEDNYVEKYDWTITNGLPVKLIRSVNGSPTTYIFEWE